MLKGVTEYRNLYLFHSVKMPHLNNLQDFLLHSLGWVMLWANGFDQLLQEIFVCHTHMETTPTVLHTAFQTLKTVALIPQLH